MRLKRATLLALVLVAGFAVQASASICEDCHKEVTPGIVKQHQSGQMWLAGIDCVNCHGDKHQKMDDARLAAMPTPETCAECHEEKVAQFNKGKHALAWVAASAMPMFAHQPPQVTGPGYKGCSGCHKIGAKSSEQAKAYRYGSANCDACHTRHKFSKEEAKNPMACMTCHMGFDHPQWEMWSTSKHGAIWQMEGKGTERAPTCQTCHMSGGDHAVMTSWGFLAVRLPEDDAEWMADRATILQALGVLDEKGEPTPRLEVVKAGKVARLTKEEFQAEREKMEKICSNCHGPSYAKDQLDQGDQLIKESDKLMAEAIRIVQGLYKDGALKKPDGWTFGPDILQFYDAETSIEQELYVMFMEHRMRTFQGAFHANYDYSHWYGWAPMKESLQKIRDEAKSLRAEHK
ncbi:multiheme c-type cytochrome [Candidatus Moduliflexota bacterium]